MRLVVQNEIQQGPVNIDGDLAVRIGIIVDGAQSAKFVHEKADARPRRATIDFAAQTQSRRIRMKTKKTYEVIAHDLRDIDPLRFVFSKPAEVFALLAPEVQVEAPKIFAPRVDHTFG
jgi:hypothetical protein